MRPSPRHRRLRALLTLAAFAGMAAQPARAQGGGRTVAIRVRVVDSLQAPIENAEISIVLGLNDVVASGASDRSGARTLRVQDPDDEFQVVVRKVGYARASQFAGVTKADTIQVTVVLTRLVQQLAAVTVTAAENLRRKSLFIDAESIAATERPLFDAFDVITKLRPDMVWGRAGPTPHCDALTNVFVNGRYIRLVPPDDMMWIRQRTAGKGSPLRAIPLDALSILASIKPEHIDAMEYHDCGDLSVQKARASSAVFVVLKMGVDFEPGIGSFVPDSPVHLSQRVPAPARAQLIQQLERYRYRLLGLFDDESGEPIAAADVTEMATGLKATTTSTGTVTLAFMRDGGGPIVLSKAGYRSDTVTVRISPNDTLPLTLVLRKAHTPLGSPP